MSSVLKNIVVFIAMSIPFTAINFNSYLMGNSPSGFQTIGSVFFIVIWFLFGFFSGKKNRSLFIKSATIYWFSGALLFMLMFIDALKIIAIVIAILFPGPLYGIKYFFNIPQDIVFVYMSLSIVYGVCLVGYFLGKRRVD